MRISSSVFISSKRTDSPAGRFRVLVLHQCQDPFKVYKLVEQKKQNYSSALSATLSRFVLVCDLNDKYEYYFLIMLTFTPHLASTLDFDFENISSIELFAETMSQPS